MRRRITSSWISARGSYCRGRRRSRREAQRFFVNVSGNAPLKVVEVVKNNRILYRRNGGGPDPMHMEFSFKDSAEFGGDYGNTSMAATSQIKDWSRPETGIRPRPTAAESYYYVRVIQYYDVAQPELDGEVAWSSPIFVRR